MEFFAGFFIGILSVSLIKIAGYISKKDYELVSR